MNVTRPTSSWQSHLLGIDQPWEDQVVDFEQFCRLAVSSRKLLRFDDDHTGMLGLIDPAAGVRFLSERPVADAAEGEH